MTKNKFSQDVTPKILTIRLVVTSLFMAIALGLYMAKIIGAPGLCLVFAGAIWNFFVGINTMAAFLLSLLVGLLYGMLALLEGLYINALLYTLFYIPLQFAVWIIYMDSDDMRVRSDRKMSGTGIYYTILLFLYALVICFAYSLYQEREILNLADVFVSCLLGLSAYLQSLRYREYYAVRVMAMVGSICLWIYVAVIHPNSMGAIAISLLYVYYLVLDLTGLYRFIDVEDKKKQADLKAKKYTKDMVDQKIKEYNDLKNHEEKGPGEDNENPGNKRGKINA